MRSIWNQPHVAALGRQLHSFYKDLKPRISTGSVAQPLSGSASSFPSLTVYVANYPSPFVPCAPAISPAVRGHDLQDLMLAKVVSHLKRRFQRRDPRNSQPPELRRWSDFVDPFPHVAAGGYTKYYKSHGLLDDDHPVALPERTKSDNLSPTLDISSPRRLQKRVNPRLSVHPIQIPAHAEQLSASGSSTSSSTLLSTSSPPCTNVSIPNSTVSTTSTSVSIMHRSSKLSLLGIPEGAAAAAELGKRRRGNNSHAKHASEGSGSLRRRKRRILRINGERDPAVIAFSISGMLSGASSENDHLGSPPLEMSVGSNAASEHASPTTPTTLCDDIDHIIPKPWTREDQCGYPLSERSDSRASFRTARSEFDD